MRYSSPDENTRFKNSTEDKVEPVLKYLPKTTFPHEGTSKQGIFSPLYNPGYYFYLGDIKGFSRIYILPGC